MAFRKYFVNKLALYLEEKGFVLITDVDAYTEDSNMKITQTLCRPYDLGSEDDQFIDLITKVNWNNLYNYDPHSFGRRIEVDELSEKSLFEICKYFSFF